MYYAISSVNKHLFFHCASECTKSFGSVLKRHAIHTKIQNV